MSDGVQNETLGGRELRETAARQLDTVTVSLELPVSATLSRYVRALEAARDAQADPKAKQALASRGEQRARTYRGKRFQ